MFFFYFVSLATWVPTRKNDLKRVNDIIKLSVEKIYQSNEVVEKEIAGYSIIADLLDVFINAIDNEELYTSANFKKKLHIKIDRIFMKKKKGKLEFKLNSKTPDFLLSKYY